MLIGYCRTSTLDQIYGLEAQIDALNDQGVEKIFSEQVSSVADRPELESALDAPVEDGAFTFSRIHLQIFCSFQTRNCQSEFRQKCQSNLN